MSSIYEGGGSTDAELAATVTLLRDGEAGLETLMLRRNSKIAFGGMSVFPGGRIDPGDWEGLSPEDELGAARRAAVREAFEECGLRVDADSVLPFSHWTPPLVHMRRFITWFFAARAGDANGCGTCQILQGPVNGRGHCDSWSVRA